MARHIAPAGANHFNKIQDGGKAMLEANAFPYFARNSSNMLPPLFKTTYTEQEDPILGMSKLRKKDHTPKSKNRSGVIQTYSVSEPLIDEGEDANIRWGGG